MTVSRSRLKDAAYWLTPLLLCLLVHWYGFTAWFRTDDFAWLGQADRIHSFHDLLLTLFHPQAQGTIRPLSERAFFVVEYSLFGLNSLPYRIAIFATQFAALVLMAAIAIRLTGMRAAGFWAPVLWVLNSSAVMPLGWASGYNEVLCGFFLLLAFWCLLRSIETGLARYGVLEWVAFILGFGALELMVVYPAIAAGYTLLCARKHFRRTLPMFAVAAIYAAVHVWAAPPPTAGVYVMHYDGSIIKTFGILWSWSVTSVFLSSPLHLRHWMMLAGVAILTLALAWFVWRQARAGHGAAWFCLIWYGATIAPLLPLRDHRTEYYVYLPAIGLSWLGGWALARYPGIPAFGLAALYAFLTVPQTLQSSHWNYALTKRSENLVEGLAAAHRLHPRQSIMLTGVDSELFFHVVRDKPNLLLGFDHLYLAPGEEKQIGEDPNGENPSEFLLAGHVVRRALQRNELVVYDVRGPRLRNITSLYEALPQKDALPLYVSAGDPLTADLLGPEWYPIEQDHRWMAKRATLRIGGPAAGGRDVFLHGYCTAEQLREGPLTVAVTVDGQTLPPGTIRSGEFELGFRLPQSAVGKPELQLALEVSRTVTLPSDPRELGLAFGSFEIR